MVHHHFLLVTFSTQGYINPCLQFAKHLLRLHVQVTLVTSLSAQRRISENVKISDCLKLAAFYDEEPKSRDDTFHSKLRINGSQRLRETIKTRGEEGCPITCLVYTPLLPWAAEVARGCHVPSSVLWIQPATVLGIYHYYFNSYEKVINKNYNDPSWSIYLPGLPLLHGCDLPSLMLPSSPEIYSSALPLVGEMIEILDHEETNPKVLVNTFDALEPEALKAIEKYDLIAIGPLIPSDNSFGGNHFQKTEDYSEWLNSKHEQSVVYVSFGSLVNLPKRQMEEIARGLLKTHHPFLWVIREKENKEEEREEDRLSCMEELERRGKIVPWCSQLAILSHPSLGCFVTHCGWNSTLESLASGVSIVAFPHFSDQATNAKMMVDVWKVGVRVRANEEEIVESDEVKRCIEMVMGGEERGEEMKRNAMKWKDLAREAVKEGGSSDKNLKAFVAELAGDR